MDKDGNSFRGQFKRAGEKPPRKRERFTESFYKRSIALDFPIYGYMFPISGSVIDPVIYIGDMSPESVYANISILTDDGDFSRNEQIVVKQGYNYLESYKVPKGARLIIQFNKVDSDEVAIEIVDVFISFVLQNR